MSKMAWILGFALLLITAYFAYHGYLETRVITRFDAKRVCNAVASLLCP